MNATIDGIRVQEPEISDAELTQQHANDDHALALMHEQLMHNMASDETRSLL